MSTTKHRPVITIRRPTTIVAAAVLAVAMAASVSPSHAAASSRHCGAYVDGFYASATPATPCDAARKVERVVTRNPWRNQIVLVYSRRSGRHYRFSCRFTTSGEGQVECRAPRGLRVYLDNEG